ncbi:unnamed protein product [Phytophthora lilii]|uniref:Unnamed protein product n=1 Tax=Phytophthora lilii TaxID=2077276 RepID=A0A9W6YF76_9STRA|nr:unnamed protein product [Phytophthora lilii]
MQMVLEERDLWEVVSGESKLENCATALDQAAFYWKVRILNTVKLDEAEGRQHSGRDRSGCWKPLEGKNEDSKVID